MKEQHQKQEKQNINTRADVNVVRADVRELADWKRDFVEK